MNNENRRRIINKAKAEGYQGSYVDLFKQAAQDPTLIAQTPEEKQAGLRPQHEAGRTDASMAFTDVPPNTPFNTVGMKAPIDIKKYDEQGHLVKSYENVPPGLTNIDSGPRKGTVLESPARMQEGGFASDNTSVSVPPPPEVFMNPLLPHEQPNQTSIGPQPDIISREQEGLDRMFKSDQKRREQIAKGVNPNTAFMTPSGLGADNEARAAYEYDNPATSNIGQIAGGIGFLPIDRGLDIALTAAARSIGKGIQARRYKKFKSEVDWAKWNPDTPNHPSLMDEYKQIEFQTKKSGTWMKNADGSAYKGSPAQFIQENSSHFKKAFPEGSNKLYRGVASTTPIESDIGGGAVFTADENLARNYTGLPSPENVTPGTVNKFDVPLVKPGSTGEVIDGTGVYRGAMNLLQPKSKNKYSIVSEGDFWASVEIGGKSKDWLAKQAKFQRETVIPQIKEKFGDKFDAARIVKAKARADRFDYWGNWFDKITHRKPSGAPDFEDALKTHQGAHIPKYGPKTKHIMTDDIGRALVDKDVNYGILYGLDDGGMSKYVNIHNNKPGNYLKSRIGNVGFFDMSSSDIFKGLAPLGVGAGLMNKRQEGGPKIVEPTDDDDPNAPQIGDPGADRGGLLNTVLADLYNVETRASAKSHKAAEANEVPGEGDSYRHALASAYAVNKLRNYGLSPGMSLLGANAMGLFHEITAESNNTFRESAEDVVNNLAGSLVGVFQDDKGAEATAKMLANYVLPDGMSQEYKNYQTGGFAQEGSVVDYLLPALESDNPTQFADQQSQSQQQLVTKSQQNLEAEKQKVQQVRANVIPTAKNIASRWENMSSEDKAAYDDILNYAPNSSITGLAPPTRGKTRGQQTSEVRQKLADRPESLKEYMPNYNIFLDQPDKFGTNRGVYCTTMGCYSYEKAGARQITDENGRPMRGNTQFVNATKQGVSGFEQIDPKDRQPGDLTVLRGSSRADYNDPTSITTRDHHTVIYAGESDREEDAKSLARGVWDRITGNSPEEKREYNYNNPGAIKAYSAEGGDMDKFQLATRNNENPENGEAFKFYRYIGQTPRMQRNLSGAKHNQEQADLVSKALQQQAELSANMPRTENISMIDRRRASKIESENNSQDIVENFETIPEIKKSNKQKVEQAANSVKGKIETAKQRKARVKAVRSKARAQTKAVRKGQ